MNRWQKALVVASLMLFVGFFAYFIYTYKTVPLVLAPMTATTTNETLTPPPTPLPSEQKTAYGKATLMQGTKTVFKTITLDSIEIIEDSRCPSDVMCIQAGTVRLTLGINEAGTPSTQNIKLGEQIETKNHTIEFVSVSPDNISTSKLHKKDYRFTFEVLEKNVITSAPCYVGGCSSELCSDTKDMMSICMYREEYACYKQTECKRQSNGACGWTDTEKFRACLLNPSE